MLQQFELLAGDNASRLGVTNGRDGSVNVVVSITDRSLWVRGNDGWLLDSQGYLLVSNETGCLFDNDFKSVSADTIPL